MTQAQTMAHCLLASARARLDNDKGEALACPLFQERPFVYGDCLMIIVLQDDGTLVLRGVHGPTGEAVTLIERELVNP